MPARDERPSDDQVRRDPVLEAREPEPVTGGTLAGEDVAGGSVISPPVKRNPYYGGPDNVGEEHIVEPEYAGTVAGNTTQAGYVVRKGDEADEIPEDLTEDLGPEGTIIQEVGGEARY